MQRLWRICFVTGCLSLLMVGAVGSGTALAATRVAHGERDGETDCVITVAHGLTGTEIQLDLCARAWFQTSADGQAMPPFRVVYKDTLAGFDLPHATVLLNAQAQQMVRNAIDRYGENVRLDYASCANDRAKLTMPDHLVNVWAECGNPSQWVVDNVPYVEFQSGCS